MQRIHPGVDPAPVTVADRQVAIRIEQGKCLRQAFDRVAHPITVERGPAA